MLPMLEWTAVVVPNLRNGRKLLLHVTNAESRKLNAIVSVQVSLTPLRVQFSWSRCLRLMRWSVRSVSLTFWIGGIM